MAGRADGGEVPSAAASGAAQVWLGDQAQSTPYGKKKNTDSSKCGVYRI